MIGKITKSKLGFKCPRFVVSLIWLLSLSPLSLWVTVWGLSVFAATILGNWPQLGINDPKFIAEDNLIYGMWLFITTLNFFTVMTSVVLYPAFAIATWTCGEGARIKSTVFLFLIGLSLLYFDPNQRLEWFID